MPTTDWRRRFDDPIPLPKGRQLVTLKDAARYIQKLPKAEQQIEEWQTAIQALILVAESNGGPSRLSPTRAKQTLEPTNSAAINSLRPGSPVMTARRGRDRCCFAT